MSDPNQRFFLQAIDPRYGCPVIEAMFIVDNLSDLSGLLGPQADDDPELRWTYRLDEVVLTTITERFGVAFNSDGREVTLNRWHSIRAAPYLIHTNYELLLLLDGTKKFARMSGEYPAQQHDGEHLFDDHLGKGVLHKEIELCPFPTPFMTKDGRSFQGSRHVYYAVKGEEWRIASWKTLAEASEKTSWNETYERLEGMLFGYHEWQIDLWMSRWRRPPKILSQSVVQSS